MKWEVVIGANVRHFRKLRSLTQEQLAMGAGIDLRYLGGIERGENNPTISVIGRIAEELEIHPADLLDEEILHSQ